MWIAWPGLFIQVIYINNVFLSACSVLDSVPDSRDTKMDKPRAFYRNHQEDNRLQGGNFRNNSYITPTMCRQECQKLLWEALEEKASVDWWGAGGPSRVPQHGAAAGTTMTGSSHLVLTACWCLIKKGSGEFPGIPTVRTQHSHCQGPGFNPYLGI